MDDEDQQLAVVLARAAAIVDGLAAELAGIESALEEEAYTAARYGVKIGTDGRPPPVPRGPYASAAEASEQHWAIAYRRAYERAMADAEEARKRAAGQLAGLLATMEPPRERAGLAAGS